MYSFCRLKKHKTFQWNPRDPVCHEYSKWSSSRAQSEEIKTSESQVELSDEEVDEPAEVEEEDEGRNILEPQVLVAYCGKKEKTFSWFGNIFSVYRSILTFQMFISVITRLLWPLMRRPVSPLPGSPPQGKIRLGWSVADIFSGRNAPTVLGHSSCRSSWTGTRSTVSRWRAEAWSGSGTRQRVSRSTNSRWSFVKNIGSLVGWEAVGRIWWNFWRCRQRSWSSKEDAALLQHLAWAALWEILILLNSFSSWDF